jgi:beta-fructofuranosidase
MRRDRPPTTTTAICSAGFRRSKATPTSAPGSGAARWSCTEVYQRLDRSLGVRIPGTVRAALPTAAPTMTEPRSLSAADGQASIVVADLPADQPFLVTLQLTAHARSFAIRLFENDLGTAYAFTVRGGEQRIDFDKIPNYPWFRYENKGLERPFAFESGRTYDVEIVVDDTIATLYVDGVALNARMYDKPGNRLAIGLIDGSLTVHRAGVAGYQAPASR